ncbi:phosphoribosylaminoimidazole carboxylase [Blastocladiella britannica]|nr:phosphoribosylaminoimidazole carboxylase [Blastocladiella britannica]
MDSKRIGVLGGGQLGRMLVEAAHRLNLSVVCLDVGDNTPAKQLLGTPSAYPGTTLPSGSFASAADIRAFVSSQKIDVLTVEIEHVDVAALADLTATMGVEVQPHPTTIAVIQDKYAQKQHLMAVGVPVAESRPIASTADLQALAAEWGTPLMLKAKRLAYDGRGNAVVRSDDDCSSAFDRLNPTADGDALYAEKWVPFARELAVMVVRSRDGHVAAYPVVETVHERSICAVCVAPAQIDGLLAKRAQGVAKQAVASFQGAGIFGVEMFYLPSGEILLNEIAPRPHNSGHLTQDACATSQYENHLRVLAGLPIGSPDLRVPFAAMVNIIGAPDGTLESTLAPAQASLSVPGTTVHLYGKPGCRADRKMGHINVVADTWPELQKRVGAVLAANVAQSASLPAALHAGFPQVGIIMGSDSDLPVMRAAADILRQFDVPFELTIVSAHRTPLRMLEYARTAAARGIRVIIAGAGGAAHLPGMVAACTPLPVIGVPVALKVLDGQDSLLSIVQMPRGVPVATVAINNSTNAGLLAVRILAAASSYYQTRMQEFLDRQEKEVLAKVDKMESVGWENYSA